MAERMGRTFEELVDDASDWIFEKARHRYDPLGWEPYDDYDLVETYAEEFGIMLDDADNEIIDLDDHGNESA